jgi:hypothetical protein
MTETVTNSTALEEVFKPYPDEKIEQSVEKIEHSVNVPTHSEGKCELCNEEFQSIFKNVKICDPCAKTEFEKNKSEIELSYRLGNIILKMLKTGQKITHKEVKKLVNNFTPADL